MYESAESGVWRVALGVWGGPIWQHAVSIMENHLQTNKGYTKKYRDLYIIQGDAHILFCCFHKKKYLQQDAGNTKKCCDFHSFL